MPEAGSRQSDPQMSGARERAAFRFLVAIGRGLHRYGTPVHRLERALDETARALNVRATFLATPTSVMTAAEIDGDDRTHLERQTSGAVDLGKLADLDALAQRVIAGELEIDKAVVEVDRICDERPRYAPWLQVLAFAMSSAGFACFLGARWLEVGAAAAAGLLIGVLALIFGEGKRGSDLFEPLAAFVLALLVPLLGQSVEISVPLVVLAGLIVLVPGLTFTQAVTELAQSSLVSGTSRLFGAVLVFLFLAFGSVLGSSVATALLGPLPGPLQPAPLPFWVLLAAVVATSLSFQVMFRAQPRDYPAILVCGLLTFLGARAALEVAPASNSAPLFAAFCGAVVAGLSSNVYARYRRRPALVPRVPAVMHLVPGSLGFRAVMLFGARDSLGGLELTITVALIAVAIASGLFLANALVRPRQRL